MIMARPRSPRAWERSLFFHLRWLPSAGSRTAAARASRMIRENSPFFPPPSLVSAAPSRPCRPRDGSLGRLGSLLSTRPLSGVGVDGARANQSHFFSSMKTNLFLDLVDDGDTNGRKSLFKLVILLLLVLFVLLGASAVGTSAFALGFSPWPMIRLDRA